MKKLLIYLLLATVLLSLVACKDNETPPEEEKKVYTFTSGSTQIAINADAAPIVAALGQWRDYAESPSCATTGLDKIYIYPGFEIYTVPEGDKDRISMIRLYDDTVATEEGIRVGATKEAVIAAYGTPDQTYDTNITYEMVGMYLQFSLQDGVVTSIQYA
ncbi:MAG: hypothetical protein IJD75_05980 [Clostridia bacterium]|nr:hypothetical protein [Clostridia bacterium]